ncbi:MAG: HEAT repeat domain-containing protein, partial [Planctomycetes bacterium]|nr:HEAT repeat domain-containing protein [Planctomycetota bacterium]
FFSRMSVASHGAERDAGHTGNFFNITWSLPGVAQCGPHATGAWMKEFGAWYFDLARRWDGTFVHQGPPAMRNDKYGNWDCTGGYLLAYATGLKKIHLTGKRKSSVPQLDASAAQSLINDGRGWSNKDRNSAYDKLSIEQLLARLGSWSPVVRERASMTLGRRKDDVTARLIRLLDASNLYTRLGACQALKMQRGRGAAAVSALLKTLDTDDLWLRILAAEALAGIGDPARVAIPAMLTRLTKSDPKNDPRNMEQRFFSFALFNGRGGLISKSLKGVDRELLLKAVRAGLLNQDGRARGAYGSVYRNLSFEEIKPLLPAIHKAIVEPAPSGIMFASGIRLSGIALLAKYRIKEGMPLCIRIMEIDKWGKKHRITQCLKTLKTYGPAARAVLPQLRQLEKDLSAHREARMLKGAIEQARALIKDIENATGTVKLRSINDN